MPRASIIKIGDEGKS